MRLHVLMLSVMGAVGGVSVQAQTAPEAGQGEGKTTSTQQTERRADGRPQQAHQRVDQSPTRADAAALLRDHGNSLLKASLASRADSNQAQLKDLTYTAVAAPEPKVIRKHDLVTIIVREESQYSSEGNSETSREAKLEAAIEDFIKLKLGNAEIEGGAIGPVPPRIAMNGKRETTNEGSIDRTDRVISRIAAEVVDVKPNGTLVVQGRKKVKTDDEVKIITVSGTCRAEDISADNTILSSALHDQELTEVHQGPVRNATRRGWGTKLLDVISPF